MKILQVHNRYQIRGGEDKVVDEERKLLQGHGDDVRLLEQTNAHITSFAQRIKTAINVTYSTAGFELTKSAIADFQPDILHCHNFFPTLTPAIFEAARSMNVPSVLTLHNYRLVCPSGTLFIDGRIDETSLEKGPFAVVSKKPYRNSFAGSLAVARMIAYHRKKGTWDNAVTRFIALTNFARQVFVRAGFDESRIAVKPNFIADPLDGRAPTAEGREGALFVGRLTEEKGVDVLIRAWEGLDIPLKIAGPASEDYAQRTDSRFIEFLGEVDYNRVSELMKTSAYLIFPSIWYEGLPMVLLEAFAHGLPVIGSNLGSIAEVVEDGVNGRLFVPGSATNLAATVSKLAPDQIASLSAGARQSFLDRYTPDANYQMLSSIYRDVLISTGSARMS